ncbi:MAG: diacylglycerol kinase family protein [Bacteroidota bacterium]
MWKYLQARIRSFGYAFKGIATFFASQAHAKVHLLAIVLISLLGWALDLHASEWTQIILCMALVVVTETINTALEFLVDLVSPDYHPLAGKVKDVAAGAVLLATIFSAIVWGIIFIPKIQLWLEAYI